MSGMLHSSPCAQMEQLPLVVRYVDSNGLIHEDLLDFLLCDDGVSGQALANLIITKLHRLGLNPASKLRGQAYDGAGNMAGRLQGCSTLVTNQFPQAIYMHCNAHCLNLCIVAVSKIVDVKSMWAALLEVNVFYKYSPKRAQSLAEAIDELMSSRDSQDDSCTRKRKLVDLCKTRWVARHDALVTFSSLWYQIWRQLVTINDGGGWNASSSTAAASLLNCVTQFKFIVAFTTVSKVTSHIQALSVALQERAIAIVKAYSLVSRVMDRLKESWWHPSSMVEGCWSHGKGTWCSWVHAPAMLVTSSQEPSTSYVCCWLLQTKCYHSTSGWSHWPNGDNIWSTAATRSQWIVPCSCCHDERAGQSHEVWQGSRQWFSTWLQHGHLWGGGWCLEGHVC